MDLAAHEMCRGLTAHECARLLEKVRPMNFAAGEIIVREGDAPLYIYLLLKGEVTVTIRDLSGKAKRVSTLSGGMVFGEMSAIDRRPRSADVRADSQVLCYALPVEEFDALSESHPEMKAVLLENILRHVSSMLRRLNQEVSVLAR
jgi:CRP-like cAMP-binding protein